MTREMTSFEESEITPAPESSKVPVAKLWKKFGFKGTPPQDGSGAEKRLIEACNSYALYLINPELSQRMPENGEDYFASLRSVKKPSSDASRRELHNQIALMTVGTQRSGMDEKTAIHISEFACQMTHGCSIAEAEKMKQMGVLQ